MSITYCFTNLNFRGNFSQMACRTLGYWLRQALNAWRESSKSAHKNARFATKTLSFVGFLLEQTPRLRSHPFATLSMLGISSCIARQVGSRFGCGIRTGAALPLEHFILSCQLICCAYILQESLAGSRRKPRQPINPDIHRILFSPIKRVEFTHCII